MTTVLLVGAALTAVTSVATFTTVQELRAGVSDRKASEALSIAEAGVDRMLEYIRSGLIGWGQIRLAGCDADHPVLRLPSGQGWLDSAGVRRFEVELRAWNITPGVDPCVGRSTDLRSNQTLYFAINSTGFHPTAARVIRQLITIRPLNLPVGIYAERAYAQGSVNMRRISMITPGDVTGREFIAFAGDDPYYKKGDFWPGISTSGNSPTQPVPAAIHAVGSIYLKNDNQANAVEHFPGGPLNCLANNRGGGTTGQSQWDQSGGGGAISATTPACPGQSVAPPPTSLFTREDLAAVTPTPSLSDQDYLTLKQSAKRDGIYCFFPTSGGSQCTKLGLGYSFGGTVQQAEVDQVIARNRTFVAYFDYEDPSKALSANQVHWKANVSPCDNRPAFHTSVIAIVRNGGIQVEAAPSAPKVTNGTFILPEGRFRSSGTQTINGTIIAKEFENTGNGTFSMDECWVNNMPGPFLGITPAQWMEIDR
jgi:hypothetical protein